MSRPSQFKSAVVAGLTVSISRQSPACFPSFDRLTAPRALHANLLGRGHKNLEAHTPGVLTEIGIFI